ncbi:MAG: class I SAM-dependent methyltransferase [Actinomycetota bacterium]
MGDFIRTPEVEARGIDVRYPRSPEADALLGAWREASLGWGIPEEILARAPQSPWGYRKKIFARRAERQIEAREGRSLSRAEEALPRGGSVLDVGAGGGASCLPLAERAASIVALDSDPDMLESLVSRGAQLQVPVSTITGRWPDVAPETPVTDVVVCHHVLYNVPELEPFVEALTSHARCRVVVEMTVRHPLMPGNPLWLRFHGLLRPERPSADDAVAALQALGLNPRQERWITPSVWSYDSFEEMVDEWTRRLCLTDERKPEVAEALIDLGVDPAHPVGLGAGRPVVTIWWDGWEVGGVAPLPERTGLPTPEGPNPRDQGAGGRP